MKGNDDVLMSPTSVIEDDTSGKKEIVFCGLIHSFFVQRFFYYTILCPLNLCDNTKDIERESTYK